MQYQPVGRDLLAQSKERWAIKVVTQATINLSVEKDVMGD
ncbi:hypothetical protein GCM10007866_00220 [Gluconobacter albidus]|uniref:Transposase n=1 Tax=Gluconobacter albidus TaxID=318683 RepID=A0ABQ5WYD7_9PROT|nr:hypothetical protein AA3250_2208 [Gluconobacter albidus NBRC 3250]GLQ67574.1 hypothetical protein GCM10007866_00220 [Gluconobacter albidus]